MELISYILLCGFSLFLLGISMIKYETFILFKFKFYQDLACIFILLGICPLIVISFPVLLIIFIVYNIIKRIGAWLK